jgi:hypothetical protein
MSDSGEEKDTTLIAVKILTPDKIGCQIFTAERWVWDEILREYIDTVSHEYENNEGDLFEFDLSEHVGEAEVIFEEGGEYSEEIIPILEQIEDFGMFEALCNAKPQTQKIFYQLSFQHGKSLIANGAENATVSAVSYGVNRLTAKIRGWTLYVQAQRNTETKIMEMTVYTDDDVTNSPVLLDFNDIDGMLEFVQKLVPKVFPVSISAPLIQEETSGDDVLQALASKMV